jgi:hypothetical protein
MTTAVLEENAIDPALLIRLGQVVVLWSSLESWIALLLGTLMGADLGASSFITSSTSVALHTKCIRALLGVHAHKEPATEEVSRLLDRADELRSERNELVHGLWNAKDCDPKTAIVNTVSLDRAEIIKDRLVTIGDLDELIEHIEAWIKDYAILGAKIGFPRNKNATQSLFVEQP